MLKTVIKCKVFVSAVEYCYGSSIGISSDHGAIRCPRSAGLALFTFIVCRVDSGCFTFVSVSNGVLALVDRIPIWPIFQNKFRNNINKHIFEFEWVYVHVQSDPELKIPDLTINVNSRDSPIVISTLNGTRFNELFNDNVDDFPRFYTTFYFFFLFFKGEL